MTMHDVNVVSKVSTMSGFSFKTSTSPNRRDWTLDRDAAVSLSWE